MIYSSQQLANQLKLFRAILNYLELIRTTNNLTQAQVAKRAGIKQAPISNFEK